MTFLLIQQESTTNWLSFKAHWDSIHWIRIQMNNIFPILKFLHIFKLMGLVPLRQFLGGQLGEEHFCNVSSLYLLCQKHNFLHFLGENLTDPFLEAVVVILLKILVCYHDFIYLLVFFPSLLFWPPLTLGLIIWCALAYEQIWHLSLSEIKSNSCNRGKDRFYSVIKLLQ